MFVASKDKIRDFSAQNKKAALSGDCKQSEKRHEKADRQSENVDGLDFYTKNCVGSCIFFSIVIK